jgi:hypothetical protein
MSRATWRKRAEWLAIASPPLSLIAGPLLGDLHAKRWRGSVWKASPSDSADYRRIKQRRDK